ncbi:MAG: hypothetical protein JWS12_237 [Candidatus Saccharibacteria bacterium]|nr:hypothetical protein [Candidatus Saccharibacteria bacterium]
MKKLNSRGFSAVEGLLILVIVGIIGFVGWYVYKSNKDANKSLSNASQSTISSQTSTKKSETKTAAPEKKVSDSWLEYKAPHYSIRFADGWTITKKQESNDSFFAKNDDIKYKAGQKAVVKEYSTYSGPGEFTYGFFMDYGAASSNTGKCSELPAYKLALKTDSGNDVYTDVESGDVATNTGAQSLVKGDKFYGYCVQLGASRLTFGYTVQSGAENVSDTIEQVVKTVKVI